MKNRIKELVPSSHIINSHWTPNDLDALGMISSFEEMIPIAVDILTRMTTNSNWPIVQLCGPMTTGGKGSLAANMSYFTKALELASHKGLHVFNQMPFQDSIIRLSVEADSRKEYCKEILHIFYRGIFRTGFIKELMFLPDWQSSVGARWEREEGQLLGLVISDFPAAWLSLIEE